MNKNKLEKMIQDETERDIKNACSVFNEAYIRKEKLIEKALGDPRCAYCWLVVVWQYISLWRRSDINRIPVINLPWDRDDIAMHIREGDWNAYAYEAAVKLESTINSGNFYSAKTGVGKLTIHIADPLRELVGLVYLIAYYHASDGRIHSFLLTNREYDYMFGKFNNPVFEDVSIKSSCANNNRECLAKFDGRRVMLYSILSFVRAYAVQEGQKDS